MRLLYTPWITGLEIEGPVCRLFTPAMVFNDSPRDKPRVSSSCLPPMVSLTTTFSRSFFSFCAVTCTFCSCAVACALAIDHDNKHKPIANHLLLPIIYFLWPKVYATP